MPCMGYPPRGHLQGQTRDNSNTRFFRTKTEHIYMCSYIISAVHTCRNISCLKGFTFFIIFHTHMNGTCCWKFIKNKKKQEKWSMSITRTKHVQLFWKDYQNVTFHELKSTLKKGYNWLHIWGVMVVFLFSAARGARKLMKPKHIFDSSGKTELLKFNTVFSIVLRKQTLH